MFVVAVTRWGTPLDPEIGPFAGLLGLQAYDARLRLARPLPVVVDYRPDADAARELLRWVRDRGHGAVACDLDRVASSETMLAPREFSFAPTALVTGAPEWGERQTPYADILALIRAMRTNAQETTTVTSRRKLSLGRAALTGGLMPTKTVKTTTKTHASEHEQCLYVVQRSGDGSLILGEHRLRYTGLEEQLEPTASANFATLVRCLRQRTPDALYDERLVKQKRAQTLTAFSSSGGKNVSASSNASGNDLTVQLLVIAHLQQQL